jgi:uncharacterized membrane protein YbhN (UPF0104 family)
VTASALAGAVFGIVDRVQDLDARFLVPALVLQVSTLGFRALAWRNILAAAYGRQIPVFSVTCAYATGVALNGFVPARGGEAAKVALVRARVPGSSVATIAGSLSVICVLDAVIASSIVGTMWSTGAIPSLPLPPLPDPHQVITALAVVVAVGALAIAFAAERCSFRILPLLVSIASGFKVLRSPRQFLCGVLPLMLGAWACRVAVIFLTLHAFHIHASFGTAALVAVLSGASAAVPVPGGGGSQQVLATYALHGSVSTASAMSFSFGMQFGVTALNSVIGLAAAMVLFRTLRPLAAVRAARARPA